MSILPESTDKTPPLGDSRLPLRFWNKVQPDPESGCWLWTASCKPDGYGQIGLTIRGETETRYTVVRAHRLAYATLVRPIPEGLTIDHLCRQRACVNPAHLEAVTQGVNMLRGEAPAARLARASHCVRGHQFTQTKRGRDCLVCQGLRRARRAKCPVCGNSLQIRGMSAHVSRMHPDHRLGLKERAS